MSETLPSEVKAMGADARSVGGWQPIETAPRDGTVILVTWWSDWSEAWQFKLVVWRKFKAGFGEGFSSVDDWPVLWTHMPQPISEDARDAAVCFQQAFRGNGKGQ